MPPRASSARMSTLPVSSTTTQLPYNPRIQQRPAFQFSFTALGGNGRQMAGFQNNLTRIYGDVQLGRAYRYKVERIGRIACFGMSRNTSWFMNAGSRRPNSFAKPGDQLPEIGWPYIRKVEEFVEIVDDKLDFPLLPHRVRPSRPISLQICAAVPPVSPVSSSSPVSASTYRESDWGIDVGNWGWKIPLWNRAEGQERGSLPGTEPSPPLSAARFSGARVRTQAFP